MIDVSVVIPTYNRAQQTCLALQSVLTQTRPPQEMIVVDDGSTDDLASHLEVFGSSIRLLRQENRGGGAARNLGVAAAGASWVAFLDSDDAWAPDHLERLWTAVLATGAAADLYFDDLRQPESEGGRTKWDVAGFRPSAPFELVMDGTPWVLLDEHPMMLQSSLIRTAAFRSVGGFWEDLRTAHDTHFFMKLCIGKSVCAVAGTGTHQGAGGAGADRLTVRTGPVRDGRRRNSVRLQADILERFPHLDPNYRALIRKRLAEAHWRLSRISWARHAYGDWLVEAIAAFRTDPRVVASRALGQLR